MAQAGSPGTGNTKVPDPKGKRVSAGKRWCFTWNNYDVDAMAQLGQWFDELKLEWIFGEERGEKGTPHLQGYIERETKFRPKELCKMPKAAVEVRSSMTLPT